MHSHEILLKGWLLKSPPDQRSWFKFSKSLSRKTTPRWRRRYFCLFAVDAINNLPSTKAGLNYYKEVTENVNMKSVGSIDLTHCDEVYTERSGDNADLQFAIRTKHKGRDRIYKLQADSIPEMQKWVESLCNVLGLKEKSQDENFTDGAPNRELQSTSSEGYIHIEECYSGKENNNDNHLNASLPIAPSTCPSPGRRRSSVPTRPVPSPNLSPSLRPSQVDLSKSSVLEAIPPSPMDPAVEPPMEIAPPRPNSEYDILPTTLKSRKLSTQRPPMRKNASGYDILPKVTSTYDTPPKPISSIGSRAEYDVLPTTSPAPRTSDYDTPPMSRFPSSPPKGYHPTKRDTPSESYDILPAPLAGKKRPPMMVQRSIPNEPAPPIPKSSQYINLDQSGSSTVDGGYMSLTRKAPATPPSMKAPDCGYIAPSTAKNPAPLPSDLPPSQPPPPPPASFITQDDTYDFPPRHSNSVDTFADDNVPPAPCLVLHKYVNAPSGFMSENGVKQHSSNGQEKPISMDIPIGVAPLPPKETQSIYNVPTEDHYHTLKKVVDMSKKKPTRKYSFQRVLPKQTHPEVIKLSSKTCPSSDESSDSEVMEVVKNTNTVQYLDLDHENNSEGISPAPSIQRSETDYNEIDFEKTQILTKMRLERQHDN